MNLLIPLALSLGLPEQQRKQYLRKIFPLAIPVSPATTVLVAFEAEREVKQQALADQKMIGEAIAAGGLKSAADLEKFPTLNSAFKKLSSQVQGSLFTAVASPPRGEVEVPVARAPDAGTTGATRTRSSSEPGTPPGPRA